MDSWKQGFAPLQPPAKQMVYSETIPDAPLDLALRLLVLDLVELCPPLRVRVLLCVSGGRG
jgi:hypothetical protein